MRMYLIYLIRICFGNILLGPLASLTQYKVKRIDKKLANLDSVKKKNCFIFICEKIINSRRCRNFIGLIFITNTAYGGEKRLIFDLDDYQ